MADAREEVSKARLRTNDQILSGLGCTFSEAARVLNVRWDEVRELVETGKVHSFPVGKRQKIGVESLRAFARGDKAEAPPA